MKIPYSPCVLLLYASLLSAAASKQVVIQRRNSDGFSVEDSENELTEAYLGEPLDVQRVTSGTQCGERCTLVAGCTAVMLRGTHCYMYGKRQCPIQPTTTTIATTTTTQTSTVSTHSAQANNGRISQLSPLSAFQCIK